MGFLTAKGRFLAGGKFSGGYILLFRLKGEKYIWDSSVASFGYCRGMDEQGYRCIRYRRTDG